MIVDEYDFHSAVSRMIDNKRLSGRAPPVVIDSVDLIADDAGIVDTNFGKFLCTSFEDKDANIFMNVQSINVKAVDP